MDKVTSIERHPPPLPDLGLVGDGDAHAMVRDIERAFGVDFGDDLTVWRTVADILGGDVSSVSAWVSGACGARWL